MSDYILELKDLHTDFVSKANGSVTHALNGVSFGVERGKILGLVGESGSGKSVSMLSVMKLLGSDARYSGEILLDGENIIDYSQKQMRKVRGGKISMIFQDPMTSLNPVYTIGNQICEMIKQQRSDIKDPEGYAAELLEMVGISDAENRLKQYPHELSGGQRQRIAIAIALSSDPEILVADEPTTALDVTVQAQIIDLIKNLTIRRRMTTILITHDLGIVAGNCDDVVVLYAGRVCEQGTAREIFKNPKHEYTKGLIAAVPGAVEGRLVPIEGTPVNLNAMPDGCAFCARCGKAMDICLHELPPSKTFSVTHSASCWMNELPEGFDPFEKEAQNDR